ncbi:MAG: tRNA (adenosine(37)-N6)-threonylcarbamoyltransferase complex dimerization subunit type 1 TsaB [Sphingobacteriaceae bacterium]|nr:tRNA (adenosine(37)-N6)-threonylcarbamoyltransferase complex dimerization subunit type 1 TsaB [Cytophagaceae bacterium]
MLILSIETSTRVCSVALHQEGDLLACYELFTEKSHSGLLTTLVQNAVDHAGATLADLDAVAVAKGPGSYTGLRIGVSTAKGLCYALDKPLLAINTLEAMATQLRDFVPENFLLCPMIDARRMEVYCALFSPNGQEIEPTQAKIVDESAFSEYLAVQPVFFFGDGAAKCQAALGHHENARFPATPVHPSARTVGLLAMQAYRNGLFENVVTFEPFYLKEFVGTVKK